MFVTFRRTGHIISLIYIDRTLVHILYLVSLMNALFGQN
jgi:hypothetical protein